MKFWNLKHFFELTLVENEVLDLSGQRLHRFGGRFHFEIDVVGAFESTFLLFLFEHTMTLFRFSNNLLGSRNRTKIEHIICWISVPARDKTIILFWRSISFGSAFRLNSHFGSSYCFAALSSTEFKSDSSTSFSFPFDVVIYIVSFQKRLWWWLVERPSQIKLRRIIFWRTFLHARPKGFIGIKLDLNDFDMNNWFLIPRCRLSALKFRLRKSRNAFQNRRA